MNFRFLSYLLSYTIPAITITGILAGGIFTFSNFIFVFVILPVVELLLPADNSNEQDEYYMRVKNSIPFRLMLWGHVMSQYAVLYFFLDAFGKGLSLWEVIGNTLSTGIMLGGIGITVAHELIHRKSAIDRFFGKALLISTLYLHFYIEHIRGHHKFVGTDRDPASSKPGENVYTFWFNSVTGSFFSALKLESERLKKKGLKVFSFSNQMVRFILYQIIFVSGLGLIFGFNVVPGFIAASIIGFSLLEIVNYIEHYGLRRAEISEGVFERVDKLHSWNSNFYISRKFLFELTRHSDHHINAGREYQTLRHFEDSPEHPTGYPGMIILALLPPIWFKVMDKRVLKYNSNLSKN